MSTIGGDHADNDYEYIITWQFIEDCADRLEKLHSHTHVTPLDLLIREPK